MKTLITIAISFVCVFANAQTQSPSTYRIEISVNGLTAASYRNTIYSKNITHYLPVLATMKSTGKDTSDYVVEVIIDSPFITAVGGPSAPDDPMAENFDFDITYIQNTFKVMLIDGHSGKTITNLSIKGNKAPLLSMHFNNHSHRVDEDGTIIPGSSANSPLFVYHSLVTNNQDAVRNFQFATKPMDVFRMVKPTDMETVSTDN